LERINFKGGRQELEGKKKWKKDITITTLGRSVRGGRAGRRFKRFEIRSQELTRQKGGA